MDDAVWPHIQGGIAYAEFSLFAGLILPQPTIGEFAMKPFDAPYININILALVKGPERYVFLYDDSSRAETLRTLGRYASNPELSFTWYDAAKLSQKIRVGLARNSRKEQTL